jgi:hypothetical protein
LIHGGVDGVYTSSPNNVSNWFYLETMFDHGSQISQHTTPGSGSESEDEKDDIKDALEHQPEVYDQDATLPDGSQVNSLPINPFAAQDVPAFPPTSPDGSEANPPSRNQSKAQVVRPSPSKAPQNHKMGIPDGGVACDKHPSVREELAGTEKDNLATIDRYLDIVKRLLPFGIYICGTVVVVLYGIILGGSSSPGMSNLFLVNVHNLDHTLIKSSVNNNETTYFADDISLRIGYFGKYILEK